MTGLRPSPSAPKPGSLVIHPELGSGEIVSLRSGNRALVRFEARPLLPRTVTLEEIMPREVAPTWTSGSQYSLRRVAPVSREVYEDRQTIEALRMGVVPKAHAHEYTVARAAELQSLDGLLESTQGLRLIWGEYGAGKTHILEVFEERALARGFLTARTVLDIGEVPPSHPRRLYRALVSRIRYPDVPDTGLDPLLQKLEGSEPHALWSERRSSRFLSPVLFARHHGDPGLGAIFTEYAQGYPFSASDLYTLDRYLGRLRWRGPSLLALSDYRTYGRLYVHLLGTIASWARDAGYRGVVVLLDEVEELDRLNAEHTRLAKEVLFHFAAATVPRNSLGFDPEIDLHRGGHAVHRSLGLRFEEDQPLSVAMALTPLPEVEQALDRMVSSPEAAVRLSRIAAGAHGDLTSRVGEIYRRAYPESEFGFGERHEIERVLRASLAAGQDDPRVLIRSMVAILDFRRLHRSIGIKV